MVAIRSERRLLIDLCLGESGPESLRGMDLERLRALASRLNAEFYLLQLLGARQGGLGPEPSRWLADLRRGVSAAAVQNLLRDEELREALDRFEEEGVDYILLKGAALRELRPDLAGRYQCDVDVLLRREDLERAEALLTAVGFRLDESFRDREGLLREHFHLAFERAGAVVELHWDVHRPSPPGFLDRLWAESVRLGDGRRARVLAPEHRLLFGCLHLSRHAFFGGLRWAADLLLDLPLSREALARFEEDARRWPRRAVYAPLWWLSTWGVRAGEPFRDRLPSGLLEARILQSLLPRLLLAEPWLGVPAWRHANALRSWLFSEREGPLLPLVAETSGEGIAQRLRLHRKPPGALPG